MEQNFYEVTKPALNLIKPVKEDNRLFRWLARHPRFILPFTGGMWLLMFGAMTCLIVFVK